MDEVVAMRELTIHIGLKKNQETKGGKDRKYDLKQWERFNTKLIFKYFLYACFRYLNMSQIVVKIRNHPPLPTE